jgi:mercuric ion transport protein
MNDRRILKTGLVGTFVAAVCCFTPVLVVALGAVGLSVWVPWLDYVLWPALIGFAALAAYAYIRCRRAGGTGEAARSVGD